LGITSDNICQASKFITKNTVKTLIVGDANSVAAGAKVKKED